MSNADLSAVLDRQLLLQLGDRLKRLRKTQGLGTVEMAERVGITRNTLRAVESGDPAPSIGTYLRVMSVLGVSAELALLAGDTLQPAPRGSAAAQSRRGRPIVQVMVSAEDDRHQLQDLQSLALHKEAVRLARSDPALGLGQGLPDPPTGQRATCGVQIERVDRASRAVGVQHPFTARVDGRPIGNRVAGVNHHGHARCSVDAVQAPVGSNC